MGDGDLRTNGQSGRVLGTLCLSAFHGRRQRPGGALVLLIWDP